MSTPNYFEIAKRICGAPATPAAERSSETPRTKAAKQYVSHAGIDWHYSATLMSKHAENLERENELLQLERDKAREEARTLRRDLEAEKQRTGRLLEALNDGWEALGRGRNL